MSSHITLLQLTSGWGKPDSQHYWQDHEAEIMQRSYGAALRWMGFQYQLLCVLQKKKLPLDVSAMTDGVTTAKQTTQHC